MPSAIVLLAGGTGSRVGAEVNKVLLPLRGETVLARSLRTALLVPDVARIVLVARPEDRAAVAAVAAPLLGDRELVLVDGGAERADSERAALGALRRDVEDGTVDVVAIHDVARPLAGAALYEAVIERAAQVGGAVPGRPVPGLLGPTGSVDGFGVQTPQAFRAGPLLAAYDEPGNTGTDTASYLERSQTVAVVAGDVANIKVTYAGDVVLAETLS